MLILAEYGVISRENAPTFRSGLHHTLMGLKLMSPTAYDAGAYSWIAVASLFRSSSDFVLIKKVRANALSLSPPLSYKIQEKLLYKVNNLKHTIHMVI